MLYTFFSLSVSSGISLELSKTMCSGKIKIYLFCLSSGLLTTSYCYPAFHNLCIMSEMQADCCVTLASQMNHMGFWFCDS